MRTRIDRRKIAKEVKSKIESEKRGRVTLYLNLKLYEGFQTACEKDGIPASTAVEQLLKAYIES